MTDHSNQKPNVLNRRNLLKSGLIAGLGSAGGIALAQNQCETTPRQTMGPFYPVNEQDDKNWDLTQVEGRAASARGEVFYLHGTISSESCEPISNALVEIWQACESGKYNHPGDPTDLPLDPDFQYWGQVLTGEDGRFLFKTIVPGDYPATSTWQRPPHIHVRVRRRGFRELVTQMYFAGHPLNAEDRILGDLTRAEQDQVVIPMIQAQPDAEDQTPTCEFNMTLTEVV